MTCRKKLNKCTYYIYCMGAMGIRGRGSYGLPLISIITVLDYDYNIRKPRIIAWYTLLSNLLKVSSSLILHIHHTTIRNWKFFDRLSTTRLNTFFQLLYMIWITTELFICMSLLILLNERELLLIIMNSRIIVYKKWI